MLSARSGILLRTITSKSGTTVCKALATSRGSSMLSTAPKYYKLQNPLSRKVAFKSTLAVDRNFSERDAYDVARTLEGTDACRKAGLHKLGITNMTTVHRNLTFQELFEHEQANDEGIVATAEYGDTFTVHTGKYTGRSPNDRFIVKNPGSESEKKIDWNNINMPTEPEVFTELYDKAVAHFNTLDTAYVFDGYCGANPKTRKKVRFVHEMAWQQHFVSNMFIRPVDPSELDDFEPDFTILNCCSQTNEDWEKHNLNSETATVFNIEEEKAVIFGTWYGGENKKGIFSLMNYWLPESDPPIFPMHCSTNIGKDGDVCLFFGLSGTGKTTLSADPNRALIGDDEHGWDEEGVFNFEGGCYAKTINLAEETEPDIYRAIKTDALLENVKILDDKTPDYSDVSITQNGRVSYPIFHIDGYHKPQMGGHPNNMIFLSCDAFGILPPVARLTSGQAMYHFMSGYTAKVAGTERGISEPTATFSTCFGAAFMTLHPTRYADLLRKKLDDHETHCYLVNSGWAGGPYGTGERMSIKATRSCINAILDGSINEAEFVTDPNFGFEVPKALAGIEPKLLDIRSSWSDADAYDEKAQQLATMFVENFKKYEGVGSEDYTQYGPKV